MSPYKEPRPLKLLFFIFSLGRGGAERVTANLANHWAGKGWEITVVTVAPEGEDYYALNPAVRRISINLARPSYNMLDALAQNVKRISALRRALLTWGPDVAIAMMDTACVTLSAAAQGLPRTVKLGSIRSHPAVRPGKAIWNGIEAVALGQLQAIVAQTKTTATWLAANTASRKIEVIPNPIDLPLAESGPRIKPDVFLNSDRRMMLAAGRLAPEKGFNSLIEAYASILQKHPNWNLAIVGEGSERQKLQSLIDAKGITSRVHMPGWAGNMADWYARADLYVMTSSFEGFPNTLAEALAHGIPAVSFDCDAGPRDIIHHGQDGLLVPAGNVPALSEAVDTLVSDEFLRKRFAVAAKHARDRFSMHSVSRMWEDLFADLSSARSALTARAG